MKIAVTAQGLETMKGGIETHVLNEMKALADHDVTYIKPKFPFTSRYSLTAGLVAGLFRVVTREHVEAISYVIGTHLFPDRTEYDTVIFHNALETLCKVNARKRVVYMGAVSTRFPVSLVPLFNPRIDEAIIVSKYCGDVVESFLKKLKVPKVTLIPECVDTDRFCPKPTENSKPVVLCVARVTKSKGLTEFLQVMSEVRVDCRIVICGVVEDDGYAKELMNFAAENGLNVSIISTSYEGMPEVFQSADVFVLLSHRESFGVSVIEAMSCGLPVVVSDKGALPEVVVEDVGFVCSNTDEAVCLVSLLLKDVEFSRCTGVNGRLRVLSEYSFDKFAEAYEKVVQ